MTYEGAEPEVLFAVDGGLGIITLNRPRAINALTHGMVREIHAALTDWADDAHVRAVLIRGAGERGLCAGGDVRRMYESARGDGEAARSFWKDEYRMNAFIARYPKPYVAIMDGLVMGGGVGISSHGSVRIVTERTRLAMPEVGIGLFPDIGGTYLLARAPGQLGVHMALTGAPVSGADAMTCGLADYFVPSDRLGELEQALRQFSPDSALAAHTETPQPSTLAAQAEWINWCYAPDTVEAILARLDASGAEAAQAATVIREKSPTSLKITLRAVRSAARLPTLEAALNQEYRLAHACLHSHDLIEGVRAQIIDKDRNPRWSPATIEEVTDERVATYFAPLGEDELGLGA